MQTGADSTLGLIQVLGALARRGRELVVPAPSSGSTPREGHC